MRTKASNRIRLNLTQPPPNFQQQAASNISSARPTISERQPARHKLSRTVPSRENRSSDQKSTTSNAPPRLAPATDLQLVLVSRLSDKSEPERHQPFSGALNLRVVGLSL